MQRAHCIVATLCFFIQKGFWENERRTNPFYTLGYVVYAELYIRPVKDLEWYTEIQTGGATVAGDLASASSTKLVLNGKTGISYYF